MKVAILFSGQPRFLDGPQVPIIFQTLITKYDCDVFCHAWWSPDETNNYITAPWSGLGTYTIDKEINVDEKLKEIYNPKDIVCDPIIPNEGFNSAHEYNFTSMYLSLYKSYCVFEKYRKRTNTTYDWVIRMRYDISLVGFPDLHVASNKWIYFPEYHGTHIRLLSNHVFVSHPRYAPYLFNLLDVMDSFLEHDKELNYSFDEIYTRTNMNQKCMCCPGHLIHHLKVVPGFTAPIYRGNNRFQ
jgi:hypothetical protein